MKTIKFILFMTSIISLISIVVPMVMGQPIVLDFANESINSDTQIHVKGDVIQPLKKFNFNEGNWSAYLIIGRNDKDELPKEMPSGLRFKTEDKVLLKEIQQWKFIYTEGDIATVESEFILYQNGKQVFKSGIVLNKENQGFQSKQYGWLQVSPNGTLTKQCKQFKKVNWPILFR